MQFFTYFILAFALVAFTVISLVNAKRAKTDPSVAPGPTLVPFIGRIHDLPIQYMWLKFKEWADKYGTFYKTEMLGAKFVVVSDEKIAEELLVRRAKYNSDRPVIRSLFDSKSTHGSMEYLPLMGKNQYWSRQRRLTHAYLTEATNAHYHGVMYFEAKRWLYRLIMDPADFAFTLEDMASKVMCQLTWDDPSLSAYCTRSAWGLLTQMSPAGPITNLITPLWHLPLPLNPWKRAERKRHDEQQAWWMERLLTVRESMAKGEMRPCWTRQYLESEKKTNLSGDYEASSVIGMLALVGIFTVAGPLYYFLISMVYHPEWMAAIQREVDEVCQGRLPTLDDTPNLPVLRACIKETMRWKPNVQQVLHMRLKKTRYTTVTSSPKAHAFFRWIVCRAFLRNPIKYPDPDSYRPERWLKPGWPTYQEPLTQFPTLRGMTSFGWGQRQCLGQSLTQDELVVACGALAWCFTLKHKVDPVTGQKIHIPLNKSNSLLIVKPDPFEMAFEPRSEERKQEAIRLWKEAEAKDTKKRSDFLAAARMRQGAMAEKEDV